MIDKNEDIEKNEIAPTLTLAKLYESQNQLFDALAIYDFLMGINPREDIKESRAALIERIYKDDNIKYHPLISKIFNEEQLQFFNIIPTDKYQLYSQTFENKTSNEFPEELDIEEEENTEESLPNDDVDVESELDSLKNEVEEENPRIQENKFVTVQDFANKLIDRFGASTKLNNVSVNDFFEIMKELNG
ncbi:MAG: hypothetical protein U9N34_00220 [Candidatus Cloacimonadota bacterium]|nr:hypothetical protein [Candidatus Cloacimonadota bacterium]